MKKIFEVYMQNVCFLDLYKIVYCVIEIVEECSVNCSLIFHQAPGGPHAFVATCVAGPSGNALSVLACYHVWVRDGVGQD